MADDPIKPLDDAASVVRELSEQGITCCAATNQDSTRAAHLDASKSIQELFPSRFFSCHLKAAKPSIAYFHAVEARLRLAPASILFLDDKLENVEGARAAGWQAAHVPSPSQLRAVVSQYFEWVAA